MTDRQAVRRMPDAQAPAFGRTLRNDRALIRRSLEGASPTSFWFDTVADRDPFPALSGQVTADLVVVGGGFAGLWTALQAKERDPQREVVLVEARRIGWAASGRNGGFCEASLTHGAANGAFRFAAELDRIQAVERENFAGLRATLDRYGMDVEFEDSGVVAVATEEHQVEALRAAADPPHSRFLDRAGLTDYVRSDLFRAGLLKTDGYALVNPARMVDELLRVCSSLGIRIFEQSPVGRLRRTADGVRVETAGGEIDADRVALATNGFPSLLRRARWWTVPIYDYVLVTEPLSAEKLAEIGWVGRHGVTDSGHQFHYSRKTADDRILWGGFDAVYHRGGRIREAYDQRPETFERLADHFFSAFPALSDVTFTHKWGGMIDMSTRLVSTQGTAYGGRVAYSVGYTGLGLGATRFGAATMLDLLDGVETERTRLKLATGKPVPVPPEPFANPLIQTIRGAVARADENQGRPGPLLRVLERFGVSFDS